MAACWLHTERGEYNIRRREQERNSKHQAGGTLTLYIWTQICAFSCVWAETWNLSLWRSCNELPDFKNQNITRSTTYQQWTKTNARQSTSLNILIKTKTRKCTLKKNIFLKENIPLRRLVLLYLPFRQQPHAGSTEDVERCLFVFVLRNVSSSEAEERMEVVAGLCWCFCQGGDSWENHKKTK